MEGALGWLGDVFRFLIRLCPHLIIIKTTDQALKWVCGSEEVLLTSENGCRRVIPKVSKSWPFLSRPRTGLHWYLPVTTEVLVIPIRRQTLDLASQYLTTADAKSVGVAGILVWEVRDTRTLLTSCEDYEDLLSDISRAVIKRVVTTKEFNWFVSNPQDTDKLLTHAIRRELNHFGIKTIRFTLSDLCTIRPIGLWGGSIQT
jgi:regulator of protease activity HflC (stomatin/prohibitin superfamily)